MPAQPSYTLVVPTAYGQMLINRHDTNQANALIKTGRAFDAGEVQLLCDLAMRLPEGTTFLDIGANFGAFSLPMAQVLAPRGGVVHAFEAQRVIAYMLCGTVVLNSLANFFVHHMAVSDQEGEIDIPAFDYHQPASFGSIEFGAEQKEFIGQKRLPANGDRVPQKSIDQLHLPAVRLMKIDVEGMEMAVLRGAKNTIETHRPWVLIEWIKSDRAALAGFFEALQYKVFRVGGNLLCMPPDSPISITPQLPDWRT
ncbi:MAG: hypothetical protein RIR70_1702 [Pseudomonadota bacterium]|jgi:FkbM family methyltransferase